jgi:hypothetical protein
VKDVRATNVLGRNIKPEWNCAESMNLENRLKTEILEFTWSSSDAAVEEVLFRRHFAVKLEFRYNGLTPIGDLCYTEGGLGKYRWIYTVVPLMPLASM